MKEIVQIVSGWNTERWNEDIFQPMEEEEEEKEKENGGGNWVLTCVSFWLFY